MNKKSFQTLSGLIIVAALAIGGTALFGITGNPYGLVALVAGFLGWIAFSTWSERHP